MKTPRVALALTCACLFLAPLSLRAQAASSARLVNIATRGQVGTDANILIGGFSIGGGSKTVLVRAVGPGLGAFGVPGTLSDPLLEIVDSAGVTVASNDNWIPADLATMSAVGAFAIEVGSKDAVIVATLPPGGYSAKVSGLGSAKTSVAIMEVYDVGGAGQLVNIATRLPVGTGANAAFAGFVVAPGSGTRKLLIRAIGPGLAGFGVPGVLADPKLVLLDGNQNVLATAVANAGAASLSSATAQAGAFPAASNDSVVISTLAPGSYTAQVAGASGTSSGVALVEVYDITNSVDTPPGFGAAPRLYYASLRPAAGASGSTASGYATILFDPNTNTGTVSVSFSNLTSAQTGGHLVLGAASGNGAFVLNLSRTQIFGQPWSFSANGPYSTNDLVAALLTGDISVQLDSANFPGGELAGALIQTPGSQIFTAPAAAPALAAGALTAPTTQSDAARLLMQATYGPTFASINALMSRGITGWIDDQMALPATSALAALRADVIDYPPPPMPAIFGGVRFAWNANLNAMWWKTAATAPDQLRQRVAFALSEIFVIGQGTDLDFHTESRARYYDLLVGNAFGSFRQLLEEATLSPAMGVWLSHIHNLKANPAKGTAPDENYAREVMQLFTIGLVQLQPDGSLLLDAVGQPIPTYSQATVSETAKLLTGWSWAASAATITSESTFLSARTSSNYPAQLPDNSDLLVSMRYYDAFHDKTSKQLVSLQQVPLATAVPTALPGNQSGPQELSVLLDTLANHPNTGPFISRQLIQRLVTSNPSAGYVYRVAQVFANDGSGARGNLGAVVRAILTDYEARSPAVLGNFGYGKIKEPLLRITALVRALNVSAPNGRFLDSFFGLPRPAPEVSFYPSGFFSGPDGSLGQAPLNAMTVFNFFSPTYSPPGALAAAGLVSPELQITDSEYSMRVPNLVLDIIVPYLPRQIAPPSGPSPYLAPDISAYLPNALNPEALVAQLNLVLCANQMSPVTRASILATLNSFTAAVPDLVRVQSAIHLVAASPDSALQK